MKIACGSCGFEGSVPYDREKENRAYSLHFAAGNIAKPESSIPADLQQEAKVEPPRRCDGCRFWKTGDHVQDWEAEAAGFGQCGAIRARWDITDAVGGYGVALWEQDSLTPDERMDAKIEERTMALRNARAYVQDGSQYRAEFFTGPDFCCALFEPRGKAAA